jgi:hypothetical protein
MQATVKKPCIDAKPLKETRKPLSGFGRRYLGKEIDCALKGEGGLTFIKSSRSAFLL